MYVVVIAAQLGQTGVALLAADTSRHLFDAAPKIPPALLSKLLLAFAALAAARMFCTYVEAWIGSQLNETVVYELRRDVLTHLQRLPLSYHEKGHSSDSNSVLYSDLEVAKNFVVYDIQRLIALPISFAFVGIYLLTVHPLLGLIALCIGPLQLLSNMVLKVRFQESVKLRRKVTRDVFFIIGETLQGIREVKANQLEKRVDEQMLEIQGRGVKYNVILSQTQSLRAIAREIPREAGYVLGIATGASLLAAGAIGTGGLVAFISLLDRVAAPFTTLVGVIGNLQEAIEGARKLYDVMDMEEEDQTTGITLSSQPLGIRFDQVSFGYDVERDVLHDVSFSLPAGKCLALVGPSGSGKTTLVKLLYRFYDASAGEISIGDESISTYSLASLRSQLALVSQDIFLFDASVAENIEAGRPGASREDVIRAAELAQASEFIEQLPDQYDSKIGERGIRLSHGQKQRLSIARAILRDASILILDEPTSALDVETEALFQRDLGHWADGCTKIVIAHRLTTIQDADLVLFLEAGRVVEFGPPSQLLKTGGRFAEYWRRQSEMQFKESPFEEVKILA